MLEAAVSHPQLLDIAVAPQQLEKVHSAHSKGTLAIAIIHGTLSSYSNCCTHPAILRSYREDGGCLYTPRDSPIPTKSTTLIPPAGLDIGQSLYTRVEGACAHYYFSAHGFNEKYLFIGFDCGLGEVRDFAFKDLNSQYVHDSNGLLEYIRGEGNGPQTKITTEELIRQNSTVANYRGVAECLLDINSTTMVCIGTTLTALLEQYHYPLRKVYFDLLTAKDHFESLLSRDFPLIAYGGNYLPCNGTVTIADKTIPYKTNEIIELPTDTQTLSKIFGGPLTLEETALFERISLRQNRPARRIVELDRCKLQIKSAIRQFEGTATWQTLIEEGLILDANGQSLGNRAPRYEASSLDQQGLKKWILNRLIIAESRQSEHELRAEFFKIYKIANLVFRLNIYDEIDSTQFPVSVNKAQMHSDLDFSEKLLTGVELPGAERLLQILPAELVDYDLSKQAIESVAYSLFHVPDSIPVESYMKLAELALKKSPSIIECFSLAVANKNPALFEALVLSSRYSSLRHISKEFINYDELIVRYTKLYPDNIGIAGKLMQNPQSYCDLALELTTVDTSVFEHVDLRLIKNTNLANYHRLCKQAVAKNPNLIRHMNHDNSDFYRELLRSAVTSNPETFKVAFSAYYGAIPPDEKNYYFEIAELAISRLPAMLRHVLPQYWASEPAGAARLAKLAVIQDPAAIQFVPDNFIRRHPENHAEILAIMKIPNGDATN